MTMDEPKFRKAQYVQRINPGTNHKGKPVTVRGWVKEVNGPYIQVQQEHEAALREKARTAWYKETDWEPVKN